MDSSQDLVNSVKELYNRVPYQAFGMDCFPVFRSLGKSREELSCWGKGKSALEAGCGAGHITCFLSAYVASILGIDISSKSLNFAESRARELGISNAKFLNADIFDSRFLAANREKFDYIICYGVLHHTPNPYLGFGNLLGLLKPGGEITIGLYSRTEIFYRLKRKIVLMIAGKDWGKRERWARRLFFFGRPEQLRIFDGFVHPVVSFHSIYELYSWGQRSKLQYLGSWPPIQLSEYLGLAGIKSKLLRKFVSRFDYSWLSFVFIEMLWIVSGKSVMVSITYKKPC